MPWGDRGLLPGAGVPRDEGLRAYYQRLIAIRRAHPALWRGERKGVAFGKDHLIFQRRDPDSGDLVLVAVNRGEAAVADTVSVPDGWQGGGVDLLGEGRFAAPDGRLVIEIPRRTALILAPDGGD
jgi:alpha-amylase